MRVFFSKRVFMVGEGQGGGSGGGAGGGTGGEEPLTVAMFNELFHKASTEREKRFESKLLTAVKSSMETTINQKFDQIRELIVESPDPEPKLGQQPGQPMQLSPEVEARMRQLENTAKEASDRAKKWEAEATAEKQRVTKNEERQAIQGLLNGNVKPAMLEMLVDQMHAKNMVRDPETQTILWKDTDGGTLPLKDGVGAWLKSDMGKEFAPPRSAQGSGGRGSSGAGAPKSSGPMSMEELGSVVLSSIPGQR